MLHHLHKKRQKQKEPFDFVLYWFVFTTPLFELPQAIEIYTRHSAHDVSVISWAYFLLSNIAWLIYGIKKRLPPVIAAYTLYMLFEGLIVIGIIIYS